MITFYILVAPEYTGERLRITSFQEIKNVSWIRKKIKQTKTKVKGRLKRLTVTKNFINKLKKSLNTVKTAA